MGLLATMPPCGSNCLLQNIQQSDCALQDLKCSCNSARLNYDAQVCVLGHCSIKQALTTKKISARICNEPIRSRQYTVHYAIIGFSLMTGAYVLRMIPKMQLAFNKRNLTQLWWDDMAISFSMLMQIPAITIALLITKAGLGKDVWEIPFPNITWILKLNYVGSIIYTSTLGFIKISLLLTYLRVFPSQGFQRWVYFWLVINFCFVLAVVLLFATGCQPTSHYWHRWDLEHKGHCADINAGAWSVAAINMALDFIILFLPMRQLWALQLNKRKKFMLFFMFGLGGFASIVSILRLHGILKYAQSKNLTWDSVPTSYWSRMEVHAAFICACLPAIYVYLRRFWTKTVTSVTGSSNKNSRDKPMSDWMASIDRHVRDRHWKFNSVSRTRLPTVGESEEELPEIPKKYVCNTIVKNNLYRNDSAQQNYEERDDDQIEQINVMGGKHEPTTTKDWA
ncbi:hypothetical protein CKM354_001083900 [Cercospora kikuchii]|uniref:CFEM domain-containing protein n=1 Tax=Cercospora kikuchii TaxID=84275 RepID=A0A9P3CS25_9PEZI|nr:uncharacterized protein CKM354_001083900 [Cercospora kikuchii]GIZ47756.1 hypothetical protein CKM354_001083900 [Cercospora kikuchii]